MSKYITYDIETLEDVKLAQTLRQIDMEPTMDYIAGSTLRGAYIYRYIQKFKIPDINQGEHRRKLLNGGITFLNAYPSYENIRSIPFPKCYFANKERIKSYQNKGISKLALQVGRGEPLGDGYEKVRVSEFISNNLNHLKPIKVEKISNLHINQTGEKNHLFRYEAIKRGQGFKGIIKVEQEEDVQEVIDLFQDARVYIGGSKGSGYGKCRIYNMQLVEENPEAKGFESFMDFRQDLYILALSDILYRTDVGEYKTFLEEDFLQNKLGLDKVEYINSSIETRDITSFNNKWGCYTPQIRGIKAGSVFQYEITGKLTIDKVQAWMNQGIGERKQEGFGRVLVLNDLPDALLQEPYSLKEKVVVAITAQQLEQKQKAQVEQIINHIFKYRMESLISSIVLEEYQNIKNPKGMKESQWGTYMDLFTFLQYQSLEEGQKIYKDHMKHIEEKKSFSAQQMNRVRYKGGQGEKSLREFWDDCIFIENGGLGFFNRYAPRKIEMDGITSKVKEDFIYQTNIKVLTEICRYHLRKED